MVARPAAALSDPDPVKAQPLLEPLEYLYFMLIATKELNEEVIILAHE